MCACGTLRTSRMSGVSPECAPRRTSADHSEFYGFTPQPNMAYADLRTALSTSVLPSDQIAPGTL
jgi:hypothetical protein